MQFRFVSKKPHLRTTAQEPEPEDDPEAWRRDAERLMEMGGFVRQPDGRLVPPETIDAS